MIGRGPVSCVSSIILSTVPVVATAGFRAESSTGRLFRGSACEAVGMD